MTRDANPIDETTFSGRVAAKIQKRRKRMKLKVKECAIKSGIPPTSWHNIERGKIDLDRLPVIALGLDCSVKALIPDA